MIPNWGPYFVAPLLATADPQRQIRGEELARAHGITLLGTKGLHLKALAQGSPRPGSSRPTEYQLRLSFPPIAEAAWQSLALELADAPSICALMAEGQLNLTFLRALRKAQCPLLPTGSSLPTGQCSCPDSVNPCKHLVALYICLADHIDAQPWWPMALHGWSPAAWAAQIQALREGQNPGPMPPKAPSPTPDPGAFPPWLPSPLPEGPLSWTAFWGEASSPPPALPPSPPHHSRLAEQAGDGHGFDPVAFLAWLDLVHGHLRHMR